MTTELVLWGICKSALNFKSKTNADNTRTLVIQIVASVVGGKLLTFSFLPYSCTFTGVSQKDEVLKRGGRNREEAELNFNLLNGRLIFLLVQKFLMKACCQTQSSTGWAPGTLGPVLTLREAEGCVRLPGGSRQRS